MKKVLLLAIVLYPFFAFSQPANPEGTWMGTINVGIEVRLVVNLAKDADGKWKATMDSPDQGARGIPVSAVSLRNDSLLADVDVIPGKYQGKFVNDTTLSGVWIQGPGRFNLVLNKVTEIPKRNRPQAVNPPFSYQVEEVEFDNADKTVHLAGTFTYPATGTTFPTAILITGSGQQDRDETIMEHKPFAVLADHLTKNGMAVLRLDDRGAGKSTGEVRKATSADFANDIEEAIRYIAKHPAVDKKRIGLIGHSEGGLIASLIAAKNKDVDFIVLLAGPGVRGSELLAQQAEAIIAASGFSADEAKSYRQLYTNILNAAIASPDSASAYPKAWQHYTAWKNATTENTRSRLGITTDEVAGKMIGDMITGFRQPWMTYFLERDAASLLSKTSAKVLALNGSRDLQVLAMPNLEGIRAALKKSKSPAYEVKELQGMNHLFQTCQSCTINEYGSLEETFSPLALEEITKWLKANVTR